MRAHGELSAEIGERLREELAAKSIDVIHDHWPKGRGAKPKHVGRIVSWFGKGKRPTQETALGMLDIAVVEPTSRKAVALVEIEETSNRPKSLMGDVFGTLLGDRVTFHGQVLKVGAWTTLIVMSSGTGKQEPRNDLLVRSAKRVRPHLLHANRSIGEIVVESYDSDAELEQRLRLLIQRALRKVGGK